MSDASTTITERAGVVYLTIVRPQQRNALNSAVLREFHDVLDELEGRPGVSCLVLQAKGGFFCSGMDFQELLSEHDPNRHHAACVLYASCLRRLYSLDKVVVASVEGDVIAGGVGLVAASDFVMATAQVSFSLPEAFLGLVRAMVFPYLVRRIGASAARSMALTTLPISGRRAFELGLVDKITEEPERALHRLCARITKLPPESLKGLKRMAEEMAPLDEKSLKRGTQWTFERMTAAPTRKGIEDFLRCRAMPWEGRT